MDTLYTFRDNITHYKTKSVHFWGLMNSATKFRGLGLRVIRVKGLLFGPLLQGPRPWAEGPKPWTLNPQAERRTTLGGGSG